ncbi:MAG: M23 family metallopeptidase [Rikenellaceae bacterium]
MFKATKIILAISIITLSSCSIFTSKNRQTSAIDTQEQTQQSITDVYTEPSVEDLAERNISTPEQTNIDAQEVEIAIQRAKIGPFTAEQSASVVIPEFKNSLLFKDIELSYDDMLNEFHYPVVGEISSPFGWRRGRMHSGVDLRAPKGSDIYAAFDGVVRFAKYNGAYGNCIVIRHYNGLETMYAHATKLLVKVNDEVSAGDVIATVGRTGRATGDHLHFEVRAAGQCFDPKLILNMEDRSLVEKNLYVTMRSGRVFASNSDQSSTREDEIKAITSVKYHIVKSGDTLSRIAANNRTTVTNLCKMNNISSTSILSIGQRVRVQ